MNVLLSAPENLILQQKEHVLRLLETANTEIKEEQDQIIKHQIANVAEIVLAESSEFAAPADTPVDLAIDALHSRIFG